MARTVIPAAAIAAGTVDSSKLADDAVTSAKIAADAVTADAIADDAVGANAIADGVLPGSGDFKDSVGTVVTTNVNLASPGVLLGAAGRVALIGQTDASEVGIYDFTDNVTALTRSSDADSSAEVTKGMMFMADDTGKLYRCTSAGTLDTDDVVISEFDEERAWVTVTGAGNGSDAFLDLAHDDVDASSLMVFDGGLALTIGSGNDYTFSQGGGAGGFDRVAFEYTPSNGSNLKAMYLRL